LTKDKGKFIFIPSEIESYTVLKSIILQDFKLEINEKRSSPYKSYFIFILSLIIIILIIWAIKETNNNILKISAGIIFILIMIWSFIIQKKYKYILPKSSKWRRISTYMLSISFAIIIGSFIITMTNKSSSLQNNNFEILIDNGNFDEALIEINKEIKQEPNNSYLLAKRGYIFYNLNDLEKASLDIEKSIIIDPSNSISYLYRAYIKDDDGNLEEAEEDYTKSIMYNNGQDQAFINRGYVRLKMNNLNGACNDLRASQALTDNASLQDTIAKYCKE